MGTKCEPESNEVFSNAEFYHLRNCLVELIEEVKLRRSNDAESEERIKLLVNEKYELERKYDGEQGKMAALEDRHHRHLVDMERNFQEKMHLIEEENKQLKIYRKCGEKETDALKDSVRSLQLAKYSLEKNLRDQEHKLQSHLSYSDQQLGEITALEQKMQSMTAHFQQLTCSQERLAKNVTEAVKLNKSLMYVNEHQKCVMEQQKSDLHRCQQQVIQLGSQLESLPASTVDVEELRQRLGALQHQIKIVMDQKEVLEKELEDYKLRQKKTLDELQETHNLVRRHLDNANQHKTRSTELEQVTETLKSKVRATEEFVDMLHKELDVEKTLKSEALAEWIKQEKMLKVDLEEIKRELDSTKEARTVLEELNIQLTESNVILTQQYQEAKAILDTEKMDIEQQTSLSHFNTNLCGTQTETSTSDHSVQTLNDTSSISVQTINDTSTSIVQTDCPQYVSVLSQTFVPPLANRSAQTIRVDTFDKDVQAGEVDSDLREAYIPIQQDVPKFVTGEDNGMNGHTDISDDLLQRDAIVEGEVSDLTATDDCIRSDNQDVIILEKINTVSCERNVKDKCETLKCNLLAEPQFCQKDLSGPMTPTVSDDTRTEMAPVSVFCPVSTTLKHNERFKISTPTRSALPVAKHGNQQSDGDNMQRKQSKVSEHDSVKMIPKEPQESPCQLRLAKSRPLYSEGQLLWGAPAAGEEPKDWQKKKSNSSKDVTSFVSISETWTALISAEEQKKKASSPSRKSPRTKLKMGLKILAETTPSRPHKLPKPIISGLEDAQVSSGVKLDGRESPNKNMSTKSVCALCEENSQRTQKSLRLQRSSKSLPIADSSSAFNSSPSSNLDMAGGTGTHEKSKTRITKGILKVPWASPKSSKSVHFGSVVTAQAQSFQTSKVLVTSSSVSTSSPKTQQPLLLANKPSGEQLLFSDEDEEQLEISRQYENIAVKPQLASQTKRRKLSTNEDE